MSIYGSLSYDSITECNNDLERYIQESFLEGAINESASDVLRSINKIKNNGSKATKEDIDKIYENLKGVKDNKTKAKLIGAFLTCISGFVFSILISFAPTKVALIKYFIASIGSSGISIYLSNSASKDGTNFITDIKKAKSIAMKKKDKAEKLDDKETVKNMKEIINICENLENKFAEEKRKLKNKKSVNEDTDLFGIDESLEYDYLVEFKGSDVKNNLFIDILNDVDNLLCFFMQKINIMSNGIDELISTAKKIKPNDLKKSVYKFEQISKNIYADSIDLRNKMKIDGATTWSNLSKEIKKFNNKYSYITMEEKKKLSNKIEKYKDKLEKIGEKYSKGSKYEKELNDLFDKLDKYDYANSVAIYNIIFDWSAALIKEINLTIGDINIVLKDLDIEKTEKSVVYKVLNINKPKK